MHFSSDNVSRGGPSPLLQSLVVALACLSKGAFLILIQPLHLVSLLQCRVWQTPSLLMYVIYSVISIHLHSNIRNSQIIQSFETPFILLDWLCFIECLPKLACVSISQTCYWHFCTRWHLQNGRPYGST